MADEELDGSPSLRFEDDEFVMEDIDSPFFLLLLDPIVPSELQDDDKALFEEDEAIF